MTHHIDSDNTQAVLPILRNTTITAYQKKRLSFNELYQTLLDRDAVATGWLQDVTEHIAPANPREKEKYAHLALELYYLLLLEVAASAK